MRITPLEIRQKSFEKVFRGYDKDEVAAFLASLSNEWERSLDENKELKIKLEQAEKEVQKLREVESSLFKTLKTAEDTGANMVEQANKTAELHMKETQMKSEGLLNESKNKAKALIEKAESQAREIMDEMETALQKSYSEYKTLEHKKKELIRDLKRIAGEVVDKADTFEEIDEFNVENFAKRSKSVSREYGDFKPENNLEIEKPKPIEVPTSKDLPSPSKVMAPDPISVDRPKPEPIVPKKEVNGEVAANKKMEEIKLPTPQEAAKEIKEATGKNLSFFDELED